MIYFKTLIFIYALFGNIFATKYLNILFFDLIILGILLVSIPCSYILKRNIIKYFFLLLLIIFSLSIIFFIEEEKAKVKDFIVYSKIFFYLIYSVIISCSKLHFSANTFISVYKFIVILFFCEYLITQCLGINHKYRPSLFVENNFELIFLLILYIVSEQVFNFKNTKYSILVCFSVFLSMSISGLVAYLFYQTYKIFFYEKKICFSIFIIITSFVSIIGLFIVRFNTLEFSNYSSIDRVLFFTIFIDEFKNDYVFPLLIGKDFMTPLSYENAVHLDFYTRLFSDIDNHLVYSVIFHALNLRIVYDFGLVGIIFVYFTLFKVQMNCGADTKLSLLICLIILLSGLSVSSLNSSIIMLSFIVLLLSLKSSKYYVYPIKKIV